MLRIFIIQTNRRKHGPPTLGSYTGLTLSDKNASKIQTKRPIKKLEKADILIIIWKHIQPISSQIMGMNVAQILCCLFIAMKDYDINKQYEIS